MKLHLYDYLILGIVVAFIGGWIIGYNISSKDDNSTSNILNEISKYKANESFLLLSISNKEKELIKIKFKNDSLNLINSNIEKERKINYTNYEKEINKDKKITTINDVNSALDSILCSVGIRSCK